MPTLAPHELVDEEIDDLDGVAPVSHGRDLRAAFVPGAGMVGCSLRHRGEELLGRRGGLHGAYLAPAGDEFICFEPMTASTNALVTGSELREVPPGESFRAEFGLHVDDV